MAADPVNAVDRSELEALRAEIAAGFGRLEGKFDAYQQAHATIHAGEQASFNVHLREATAQQSKIDYLADLPSRVDKLEDWRTEVRTLGTFIRLTFGTSVVGAVVSVVALIGLIRSA